MARWQMAIAGKLGREFRAYVEKRIFSNNTPAFDNKLDLFVIACGLVQSTYINPTIK
jgi:hypothetical protein